MSDHKIKNRDQHFELSNHKTKNRDQHFEISNHETKKRSQETKTSNHSIKNDELKNKTRSLKIKTTCLIGAMRGRQVHKNERPGKLAPIPFLAIPLADMAARPMGRTHII